MAHKVTIECEARFVDHLSNGADRASDSINDIGSSAEKAEKKVDKLGKKKFRPIFDADNNKFLKKIREAEARAEKLGKTKTTVVLKALDKATNVIGRVLNKAQSFGGKVWSAILRVKDSNAVQTLGKVTTAAKNIAGKTWQAVVKVKDNATDTLTKIKNSLFNIKTLAATIVAGVAAKKVVLDPINLADQYSSAKIGFSTLLGDKRGQEMMDEIDLFAKKTPFKTSGVISNVQKMMAYGWDVERVIEDMETIGDAAASTGRGDEGLESIVYALSEIRSKGKLSTQELNQLASAGIKAKQYLAQGLGYGTDDEGMAKLMKDLEKGAIGANQAIDLILQGMEEFDGMMDRTANETVEGLISQVQDAFEINVFRRWGQGLQDGAKRGLGTLVSLLDDSEEALSSLGDTLYNVGKAVSNWAADKLEKAVKTIKEVTATAEFKNASLGGKIKILWNEVIAEPFSEWWNKEGKVKVAEIASDIGKGLGSGITGGLCALLGFDAEGAIADGVSIGSSFMEGFLEGFDTDKIGEALSNWVNNNKGLASILGGVLLGKLFGWAANIYGNLKGSNSGTLMSEAYAGTMNVSAGVVNVYGLKSNNIGEVVDDVADAYTAKKLLDAGSKGTKLLKAGDTASDVAKYLKAGDTAADGAKLLNSADNAIDMAKLFGNGGKAAGTASKFSKFFSKAAPILTILDFAIDGISGYTKAKNEGESNKKAAGIGVAKALAGDYDAKGAGGRIWSAFSNTLKGAGLGGTIGGPIGALIGAGVGLVSNIGAQVAASDASDTTKSVVGWATGAAPFMAAVEAAEDPEGFKERVATFFTKTIPEGWNSLWDSVGGFFTETIPEAWNTLTSNVSTFFTKTIPEGWNSLWDSVGGFFTETIPEAFETVKSKVSTFFTETIPEAWNSFWDSVGNFFSEKVPYAIGYATGKVVTFFTETIPEKWNAFWGTISTFFTETIPAWAESVKEATVTFFTETLPEKWNALWGAVETFFTETIPAWIEPVKEAAVTFFTETLPEKWNSFWGTISTFFTETIPAWAESVKEATVTFFTETIPEKWNAFWGAVSTFVTEKIPEWASAIGNSIKTFFTETIPEWFGNVIENAKNWWSGVKENFSEGYNDGRGKARGGIVGGTSSSMEAFARGGRTDGGIVGGSTRWIRVNEESPEMIIPLSSQRRDRAMKLWAKTGQLLGAPGFARGGRTTGENDEGIRFHGGGTESESVGSRSVVVQFGDINIELKVEGNDKASVAQAIKEQISEIAESVAEIFADEFESVFENTPVRGGVA